VATDSNTEQHAYNGNEQPKMILGSGMTRKTGFGTVHFLTQGIKSQTLLRSNEDPDDRRKARLPERR
jgi:hypothetical protein